MTVQVGVPLRSGGVPELQEGEEVKFSQSATKLNVNERDVGSGTLFLGTQRVYWVSDSNPSSVNLTVDYQTVGLHALCQNPESWPLACLYCQLDIDFNLCSVFPEDALPPSTSGDSDEDDDDNTDHPLAEIRFIPADSRVLEMMFRTFCDMSTLNPDTHSTLPDSEWCTAENQESWAPDSSDGTSYEKSETLSSDAELNGCEEL